MLSLTGFLARGLGNLRGDAWVRHRPVRVLLQASPHRTPWLFASSSRQSGTGTVD